MIKNQELAGQILDMMETALEASAQMQTYLEKGQIPEFQRLGQDLCLFIKQIYDISDALKEEESGLNLPAASKSVMVSAERIIGIAQADPAKAIHKIEFELIPLIEEMRIHFYYWGTVYPDKEKIRQYREHDMHMLAGNRYQEEAKRTGNYKYEMSIVVVGYNKLEYTRKCVESLLENLPENISYELILVNHGSSDGTKEYFESVHPDKQLDIAVNGGGSGAINRIVEGKYILAISNDVIVTENAIANLYECIASDETISWAVPSTSNVSNLQALDACYNNLEELKEFAHKNNVSDRYRWEQRVRLCDPLSIKRSSIFFRLNEQYIYSTQNSQSFPDDRRSLLSRRNGYKMYLVKNAYCHHYGQVTLKSETDSNFYLEGRKDFEEAFGVDPWSTGFCYSYELFEALQPAESGEVSILGINCGLGSNSLKIKEELKERAHNEQVFLKNITTKKEVLEDLKGISDEAVYIGSYKEIERLKETYDYIISEAFEPGEFKAVQYVKLLSDKCKANGKIILDVSEKVAAGLNTNIMLKKLYHTILSVCSHNTGRTWVILSGKKYLD